MHGSSSGACLLFHLHLPCLVSTLAHNSATLDIPLRYFTHFTLTLHAPLPTRKFATINMRPPTIHVQDADRDLTLRYVHGKNELDLKAIYTTVSSLHNHPGRDRLDYRGMAVGCSDT